MYIEEVTIEQLSRLKTSSVFNSTEWLSVCANGKFNLLGIYNKNKELIGTFYYNTYSRGKILTQLSASPYTPHCGLFIKDETVNPSQKIAFKKNVINLMVSYLKEQKFDILSLPFPIEFEDMQGFIWKGYSISPRYTYHLDLSHQEETLLSNMSSERRKNIRKAEKDGIITKRVHEYKEAKELIRGTFNKKQVAIHEKELNAIFEEYSNEKNTICILSYNSENKPLSCVYCVFDEDTCYYLFGGFDSVNKHEGAGALAMWEAIKIAKSIGIKTFDFEGSMLQSVEKYFRGFGGELKPFYTVTKHRLLGKLFTGVKQLLG